MCYIKEVCNNSPPYSTTHTSTKYLWLLNTLNQFLPAILPEMWREVLTETGTSLYDVVIWPAPSLREREREREREQEGEIHRWLVTRLDSRWIKWHNEKNTDNADRAFCWWKTSSRKEEEKKINHGLCPNASGAVIQERKPTTRGQAHQAGWTKSV